MRILMLSNPDASHTLKWATGLARRGVEVLLLGVQKPQIYTYENIANLTLADAGVPHFITQKGEGSFAKLFYLKAVSRVRAMAKTFRPDVVHAHYASSYGLIGALSGVRPFLISVWGSDVYEFPDRSWVNRRSLEYSLSKADALSSTSKVMAERTRRFTSRDIEVVPFGIDPKVFCPASVAHPFSSSDIVIGTVKTLHEKYGIRYLIEAFALLKQRRPELPLKLLIVGKGPQEAELKRLVSDLGLNPHVHFTGFVPASEVVSYHNMLDVFAALSTVDSESFGVAVIEAGACAKPVVVSDAGGLPEVVSDGRTGLIVPRCNSEAASFALERLALDAALRRQMGQAGREHVCSLYDLDRNLDQMIALYKKLIN